MKIAYAIGYAVGTTKAVVKDLVDSRPKFDLQQIKADYAAGKDIAKTDNTKSLYELSPEELARELRKFISA